MDLFTTFDIAASGLKAQTTRLNTISSNLANAETTSTPEGGAVQKKICGFSIARYAVQQAFAKISVRTGAGSGRAGDKNPGR